MAGKLRADTQRTRDRLLDSAGRLAESRGFNFSLPELAREAGVSTATAYRHFDAIQQLQAEFYHRSYVHLMEDLEGIFEDFSGFRLFNEVCGRILNHYVVWARPASMIRSPRGYLERYHEGDKAISWNYGVLERVLNNLIELGIVPDQDQEAAILLWATIFDERVYLDFRFGRGLSEEDTRRVMSSSVLSLLRTPTLEAKFTD
ncbi:TetR/AcrR family transcriptional regulator [Arthrobacter sp. NPDC080031]|uniref:TetR/AcrR family transcriptional regulator n=1 Tax=Arthrobacter sp. NPDC080031 TaxID=3155918 RepID=UPI00344ED8BB